MIDDPTLRFTLFFVVLAAMGVLEAAFPRRVRKQTRQQRWPTNFTILILEIIALRLLGPFTAIVAADYAMDQGWGLLAHLTLPFYIDIIISFILLDLAIYVQHLASHKIPLLWRIHKVHHVDRDIDVTTGFRFHPLEAALSMLYKCLIVLLLGPIMIAVIFFEIILNLSAMFNHANVSLPKWLDRLLRLFIITPDVHRVHHSTLNKETDSNYGFFLSLWDKLFHTYTPQPQAGHQAMTIGLSEYQTEEPSKLQWSLALPFTRTRVKSNA